MGRDINTSNMICDGARRASGSGRNSFEVSLEVAITKDHRDHQRREFKRVKNTIEAARICKTHLLCHAQASTARLVPC